MHKREFIKSCLPHLIAVVIFIVVAFAYFYPVLEGKILRGNDATVSKINSKEIQDYRDKFHKEPLWTNSIFSGMPAYLISTRYPGILIKYADAFLRMFKMPVSVLFLSMLGFYVLLLMFRVNPWLAITGALAYGFSSFFFQVLVAGHNTQAVALAYMPPMIGGIYYAYRYDRIRGAILSALFLSLEIQANHPQVTYYAVLCLLVFAVAEFVSAYKDKKIGSFLKTTGILVIPFIIALGVNFASLYTTWEYGKYSIRGKSDLILKNDANKTSGLDKDYIVAWSYGVDETFNMLIPNYKGGSSHPFNRDSETANVLRQNKLGNAIDQFAAYWGPQQWTEGPHYVGAIVIFLFILGLILIKGPEKWWLLGATLLSIMLAWGKNFMPFTDLFINFFPEYNKFRAVTMILVIAEFCIPLLGILALRDIFDGSLSKQEVMRALRIAAGITGGFLLLILVLPGIAGSFLAPYEKAATDLPDWIKTALVSDRKNLLRADSFRSLVFVIAAAGVILGFLLEKLKKNQAIIILGILILFDLWTVDKRYLDADRFENPSAANKVFTPTPADQFILKDNSYFRVLNLSVSTFNDNSPTSWFFKSIGGYHGAKMKRYQELIDSSLTLNIEMIANTKAKSVEDFLPVFSNTNALNMLNAKYIIYRPDAPPLTNPNALGNAWFAVKPVFESNANDEIMALRKFNPASDAIINASFKNQVTRAEYSVDPEDKIGLTSYEPNELVYKYSAKDEKLAIFSEIYYPAGWKCYIDGKESRYFRADWTLRAMIVPAGNHEIKFTFRPASYYTGNKVSLASSIILILLLGGYVVSAFVRKPKE